MSNYSKIKQFAISYLKKNLSESLYYHGLHHTLDVLQNVEEIGIAENCSKAELKLLRIAVLFHDIGFANTYNGHEEAGCELARKTLPDFNVSTSDVEIICGMIMATKIPQKPKTNLESIIADADLLYLGTRMYNGISETLFREIAIFFNVSSEKKWNKIQYNFISTHAYHTKYCIRKYEPIKQKHLQKIKSLLKE